MFFYLSKIAWSLVQPSMLVALLIVSGLILMLVKWRISGAILSALGAAAYVAIVLFSAGQFLIAPLENRFAANPRLAEAPDGIILLGGPIDSQLSRARGQVTIYSGAERYIEFAGLLRRYPGAKGIVSGGNPSLTRNSLGQAHYARSLLEKMGVDLKRVTFEAKSRNTVENIRLSTALMQPAEGGRWLVVTSAYHMPRALGVMRAQGWNAIPYPVDFRTEGETGRFFFTLGGGEAMELTDLAVKEWIGLTAYYLTGRSAQLLPSP